MAQVEAGTGRVMEEPSRDEVLAAAIQLRRTFREWRERLATLDLPQSRILSPVPAPAQQEELNRLFGSDSETEGKDGAAAQACNPMQSSRGPLPERSGVAPLCIAQQQPRRRTKGEQNGVAGAKAEKGEVQHTHHVTPKDIKDPAAYKERVSKASLLSPTGRIGMSSGAAQRVPQVPRGAQRAELPDDVKKKLVEQVLLFTPARFCCSLQCSFRF